MICNSIINVGGAKAALCKPCLNLLIRWEAETNVKREETKERAEEKRTWVSAQQVPQCRCHSQATAKPHATTMPRERPLPPPEAMEADTEADAVQYRRRRETELGGSDISASSRAPRPRLAHSLSHA